MKKQNLLSLSMAIVMVSAFAACSGNNGKTSSGEATDSIETVENTDGSTSKQDFDVKGISKLAKTDPEDLSSKEIDFLLDQLETLVNKSEGMNSEEYRKFFDSLPNDVQEAMFTVAMQISGAEKKGKLSDEQMKRNKELEAKAPFGK